MADTPDYAAIFKGLSDLINPDPLGAVARGNSRVGGLTPQDQWNAMFTHIDPARAAAMTNHPQATLEQMAQGINMMQPAQQAAGAVAASPAAPAQPGIGQSRSDYEANWAHTIAAMLGNPLQGTMAAQKSHVPAMTPGQIQSPFATGGWQDAFLKNFGGISGLFGM